MGKRCDSTGGRYGQDGARGSSDDLLGRAAAEGIEKSVVSLSHRNNQVCFDFAGPLQDLIDGPARPH